MSKQAFSNPLLTQIPGLEQMLVLFVVSNISPLQRYNLLTVERLEHINVYMCLSTKIIQLSIDVDPKAGSFAIIDSYFFVSIKYCLDTRLSVLLMFVIFLIPNDSN